MEMMTPVGQLLRVADLGEADVDDGLGDERGLLVLVHAELVLGLAHRLAALPEEHLQLLVGLMYCKWGDNGIQ